MTPTAVPSRITIDFRDTAMPSRTWILGVDEATTGRMELIAFDGQRPGLDITPPYRASYAGPAQVDMALAAIMADCVCPDYCERDHANE